jgi:hypothetical protein
VAATANYSPIRQTVQQGPVDTAGLPTFLPATSASLNITSQNVSTGLNALVVTAANGSTASGASDVVGISTSNLTWTGCTASNTNYLPVSISGGVITTVTPVILAPIYQMGGTPSTTNGQYTFNISQMTMYKGNGTTAPAVNHVIVGEVVAGASTITSTIAYAYQGNYQSADTAVPANNTATSFSSNLGSSYRCVARMELVNVTPEFGYVAGDTLECNITHYNTGTYITPYPTVGFVGRNTTRIIASNSGAGSAYQVAQITGSPGATATITNANWRIRVSARRAW